MLVERTLNGVIHQHRTPKVNASSWLLCPSFARWGHSKWSAQYLRMHAIVAIMKSELFHVRSIAAARFLPFRPCGVTA